MSYRKGFDCIRVFAGIDETKAEVRKALKDELPLDYSAESESHVGSQLGDGLCGRGATLPSVLLGKRRDFADGFGLCSPPRCGDLLWTRLLWALRSDLLSSC